MTWIIKNLSNKISRIDMEGNIPNKTQPPGNPIQFRRPNNTHMIYRENINQEQPLCPLVCENNNNLVEQSYEDVYLEQDEEINLLQDESSIMNVTRHDYKNSSIINDSDEYQEENDVFMQSSFQYNLIIC